MAQSFERISDIGTCQLKGDLFTTTGRFGTGTWHLEHPQGIVETHRIETPLKLSKRLDSWPQILEGDGANLLGQWKGGVACMYHA